MIPISLAEPGEDCWRSSRSPSRDIGAAYDWAADLQ
jgi:hypothetical protein